MPFSLIMYWMCQWGFRAGEFILDHLVRLKTTARKALVKRQHCVPIFFDLERAYNTTWRWGVLRDLYSYGVRGRMLGCIKGFLSTRSYRVRLGNNSSRAFIQENGVPQGGVISKNCVHVSLRRGLVPDPSLHLNGSCTGALHRPQFLWRSSAPRTWIVHARPPCRKGELFLYLPLWKGRMFSQCRGSPKRLHLLLLERKWGKHHPPHWSVPPVSRNTVIFRELGTPS